LLPVRSPFEYDHDAAARITKQTGSGLFKLDLDYTYDVLGRLTSVKSNDAARREEFRYDAIGRMTWQRELDGMAYEDPAHIHAMTWSERGAKRTYDANGNATHLRDPAGRDLSFEWTVDDRIARIDDNALGRQHVYIYDISGRRVKEASTTSSFYFSPRVEIDDKGNLIKSYLAEDRLIARNTAGKLRYYHQDVGHNVRMITDAAGTVVEQLEYLAFGKPYNAPGKPIGNDIGFASAREESDLGLVLMGARTYDPTTGRFLSPDSVIPSLGRPQSLDRYSYVENDPVNHWDPSGHMRLLIELRKVRIEEAINIVPADALRCIFLEYDRGPTDEQLLAWHRANRQAETRKAEALAKKIEALSKDATPPKSAPPGVTEDQVRRFRAAIQNAVAQVRIETPKLDATKDWGTCVSESGSNCFEKLTRDLSIEIGPAEIERKDGKIVGGTVTAGGDNVSASACVNTEGIHAEVKVEVENEVGSASVSTHAKGELLPNGPAYTSPTNAADGDRCKIFHRNQGDGQGLV
jgi:RHS repeat-associated protein